MSGIADRLLQEALSGESSLRRSAPVHLPGGIRPATPRTDVFIELEIIDAYEDAEDPNVLILQTGNVHRLTVRVSSHPEGQGGPAWRLRGSEMLLSISAPECPELTLEVEGYQPTEDASHLAAVTLRQEQIEAGVEIDFRIEVPSDCPRRRGFIEVACGVPDTRSLKVCQRRAVQVAGTFVPWNPQDAATWHVDPAASVPSRVAFLYVQERQAHRLHLQGWNSLQALEGDDVERPELSLAAFIQERQPSRDIVGRIRGFSSQRLPKLLPWLHRLLAHYPDLLLVIVDNTGAEIPWELIHLGSRRYLGSEAEVVRWAQMREFESIGLRLDELKYGGHTIGFLDPSSPAAGAGEEEELNRLGAQHLCSLRETLERLSQNLEGIGLIYLACHGAVAHPQRETHRYQALYARAGHRELRIIDLDLELLERRAQRVPTVFVNACHSGRLCGQGDGLFGLPSVFLRKVADGYIGTLGEVNDAEAARIGTRILRAFRENPGGIRPSELLRQLRREAAAALDPERSDRETWQRFLFTFMYVYYGNPFIRVILTPYEKDLP